MKKLLGVSIAAMLAVTPMMANATPTAKTATPMTAKNIATNTNIATTSFVGGAYDDVVARHNEVVADIAVTTGNNVDEDHSIGQNVNTLDTAMGNVSTLAGANTTNGSVLKTNGLATDAAANLTTAVIAINNELAAKTTASTVTGEHNYISNQSVTNNLVALDDAIGQVDNEGTKNYIATIGTGDNQKTVAENVQVLDNIVGQTTGGTHIKVIGIGENKATVATNLKALDTQVVAVQGDITRLDGAVGTANSVLDKVYNNAETGKFSGTGSLASQATIQAAINEVNRKADATNTAATVANNGSYVKVANSIATNLTNLDVATKANADAITAILGSTIPVYSDWSNSGSATNSVTVGSLQGANPTQAASVVANPAG